MNIKNTFIQIGSDLKKIWSYAKERFTSLDNKIGDLNQLPTTNKGDIVSAIKEFHYNLYNAPVNNKVTVYYLTMRNDLNSNKQPWFKRWTEHDFRAQFTYNPLTGIGIVHLDVKVTEPMTRHKGIADWSRDAPKAASVMEIQFGDGNTAYIDTNSRTVNAHLAEANKRYIFDLIGLFTF